MTCHTSGCPNPGVISCSGCGKLFCGMHVDQGPVPRCEPCRVANAEDQRKELHSSMGSGCLIILVGLGIAGLGLLMMGNMDRPHFGILVLLMGLGVAFVGGLAMNP
jgi:hypothetical protein